MNEDSWKERHRFVMEALSKIGLDEDMRFTQAKTIDEISLMKPAVEMLSNYVGYGWYYMPYDRQPDCVYRDFSWTRKDSVKHTCPNQLVKRIAKFYLLLNDWKEDFMKYARRELEACPCGQPELQDFYEYAENEVVKEKNGWPNIWPWLIKI